MKAETPRNLALRVLNGLSHRPALSGPLLNDVLARQGHLDQRDRAFIHHLVQGVLRWQRRLDWTIEQVCDFPLKKISPPILNILRLALYQILFLDRVPQSAAVNEAVKQSKNYGPNRVASFVNGVLRNLCRKKDEIPFPDRARDPEGYLSIFHSYPRWLVRKWIQEWGFDFTESLLSAGNRIPVLTLRTNLLRINRPELIRRLEGEGVEGRPAPYTPEGVLLHGFRGRLEGLPSFKEGLYQVQDQAAQITSHLLSPRPGDAILDVCAGLGGKTTHMAELMGNEGRILALDIHHGRLLSLGRNSRRLGIHCITSLVADASRPLESLLGCKFDRILVDAPCSGLGVISRHPDGKWNRTEADIHRLALLQKAIMDSAAPVLRSGGRLLYVTCTLSREENEGVVEEFLESNPSMRLEEMKEDVPAWCRDPIDEQGFFRSFPHVHHMDGFFAALFRKIK